MEKMNILTLIITLVVGVILTGAMLGPVISDATKTTETFTNDGAFYVELDPTETYTIEYDNTIANDTITVNGTAITLDRDYTLVALENAILRFNVGNHKLDWNGNGSYLANMNKLSLSFANGSITGTYTSTGDATAWPTMTYNKIYVISPTEQPLIMSDYSVPVKVKGDSELVAFGRTVLNDEGTNKQFLVQIEGTINDGVNVTISNVSSGVDIGAVITDLSINSTPVQGYNDLYTLTSITFKAATTEGGQTTNVTFSAYIVPTEVTAELTNHLTPGQISLMGAIPVMVIVALLMAAVGAIALRRAD